MRFIYTTFLLLLTTLLFAQTSQMKFEVNFNGMNIGSITATKTILGKKETIDVKTNTDASILVMSIHVESEINLHKEQAVLKNGIAYRHSNRGTENIIGYTQKLGNKYVSNINHKVDTIYKPAITFTVADLYFTEPIGLTEIYSNMYGSFVKISDLGNHKYKFTTPDGKVNAYTYINGQLSIIEVELSIGKVVSKRTS
ncbi:MAG: DUF6134 family protein [Bacteroidota bacterium]